MLSLVSERELRVNLLLSSNRSILITLRPRFFVLSLGLGPILHPLVLLALHFTKELDRRSGVFTLGGLCPCSFHQDGLVPSKV